MVPLPLSSTEPRRVLLVEDDLMVRLITAEGLRDAGLEVAEARNADEALSYLAGGGKVDLLLTDVEMPGPLDGVQLAQRLRARQPDLPMIIVSGRAAPPGAAALGRFIPKPYNVAHLTDVVTALLRNGS